MRSHIRTVAVVVLALALLGLFLRNVDFSGVFREIAHAQPGWLLLSLATMVLNLVIRAWRWQFLLEPLGKASFANSFRATAVGFAARSFLPAAAGEFVRPYFLSRREPMSATGAFATIVHRAPARHGHGARPARCRTSSCSGASLSDVNPAAVAAVKWAGASAGAISIAALVVLFVMAGNPARLAAMFQRLEQVVPSALAGLHRSHRREVRDRPGRHSQAGTGWSRRWRRRFRCGCASRSASGRWPRRSASTCRLPGRFSSSRC